MARRPREPTVEVRRYVLADGSVTETWSVRYWDAAGRRVRRAMGSRQEAEFERARIALEAARGGGPALAPGGGLVHGDVPSLTLAEFWPTWRADAAGRLAAGTLREYDRMWKRIDARFGAMEMDAIRPRAVSQWRAEMLSAGVGREAARRAMVLLQAMFTVAIEWGEARMNPVAVVRKPRQGRDRVIEPILPEGVEALRAELLARGDLRSATLVSVMAYAGLRPGEALGLALRHMRDETLLIERAVSDGVLKRQKTNRAYRTVDLLAPLAADLAAWVAERALADRDALLFPRADGQPWRTDDWNNWRGRCFEPAARAAGLGRPRPYDLRHSFASLLIREQKASIVELAQQLGHAPTMTLNTYTHVYAEYRRAEPVDVVEWIWRARAAAQEARAEGSQVREEAAA